MNLGFLPAGLFSLENNLETSLLELTMSMLQYLEKDGRNAGVYASKEIKMGTLILTEVAQLTPEFQHEYDCCISCTASLMKAYHYMSPSDQKQYLKLRNRFAGSTDQDILDQRKEFIEGIPKDFPYYLPEFVSEVTEIYMTIQSRDKGTKRNNILLCAENLF